MSGIPPVMNVTVEITGAQEVAERFKQADSRVRKWTHALLDYLGRKVAQAANSAAPIRKLGRLRKAYSARFSMGRSGYSKETTERVVVRAYGRKVKDIAYAMEFGQKSGNMYVPAHKRRRGNRTIVASGARIGRRIRSGEVKVKGYSRRRGYPARPILGPTFAAMEEGINKELQQGLQVAVRQSIEDGK